MNPALATVWLTLAIQLKTLAEQHSEEFQRRQGLTRGLYESARMMLFKNVRE
ncbi:hypothetical protein [Pseudomonas canadensis]|uniref:hypothetical protein n=1 Tax=Pseudomonas canadensis TaxID=915099 RepID=UPI0030D88D41